MKRYYLEIEYVINQQYPEFRGNISGSTYPASQLAQWIAFSTNIIWLVDIALLLGGITIFKTLKIGEPDWYQQAKANPVGVFMFLFMMNSFGAQFLSTGAFEIDVDGIVIFSKLTSGRMPNMHDITCGLASLGFKKLEG